MAELLVLGLRWLVDALPVNVEKPAVIKATQPSIFDAPIGEIGPAVRAKLAYQTELIPVVAKQHKIFAHDPQRQRRAIEWHFIRGRDGLPITAQELAAGGPGTRLRKQV